MPITDVTLGYINMLMLLFETPHRLYIYDDLNNNAEPLQRWADAGKLNRNIPYPLSLLERSAAQQFVAAEQTLMLQNMYLALQAMGLAACRRELFDRRLRGIVHLAHEQKIQNRRLRSNP